MKGKSNYYKNIFNPIKDEDYNDWPEPKWR